MDKQFAHAFPITLVALQDVDPNVSLAQSAPLPKLALIKNALTHAQERVD